MCHEVRKYMAIVDGDEPMGGPFKVVEVDETFIGGHDKGGFGGKGKTIVVGMQERDGRITTRIVPDRKTVSLVPHILDHVKPHTIVHTDEWNGYREVAMWNNYRHKTVNHSKGEYVSKVTGATVNSVEGFWSQLKRGINGTHIHVSQKHLSKYLGEFEFRHNRRQPS